MVILLHTSTNNNQLDITFSKHEGMWFYFQPASYMKKSLWWYYVLLSKSNSYWLIALLHLINSLLKLGYAISHFYSIMLQEPTICSFNIYQCIMLGYGTLAGPFVNTSDTDFHRKLPAAVWTYQMLYHECSESWWTNRQRRCHIPLSTCTWASALELWTTLCTACWYVQNKLRSAGIMITAISYSDSFQGRHKLLKYHVDIVTVIIIQ
jgi:hypothetical protein